MTGPDSDSVEAIDRMAALCRLFLVRPLWTLHDLAAATEVPVRTVAKIAVTLERRDLLVCRADGLTFELGPAWLRYADVRRRQQNFTEIAMPLLLRMRDDLNETMIFGARAGDDREILAVQISTQPVRRLSHVGFRSPLHVGSSGRSILMTLTDADIEAYLARTPLRNVGYDTPTDAARIWADIARGRAQGFTTSTAEITGESFSASAPVFGYDGQAIGALTITCPLSRLDDALQSRCITLLRASAATMSQNLGYAPNRNPRVSPSPLVRLRRRAMARDPNMKSVQVIDRAITLLDQFNEGQRRLTLQQLADGAAIHKATAFRLVGALVAQDLLRQVEEHGTYELGFTPLVIADALLASCDLRARALPHMQRISRDLNESVVLAVRYSNGLVNIDQVAAVNAIVTSPEIGIVRPSQTTPQPHAPFVAACAILDDNSVEIGALRVSIPPERADGKSRTAATNALIQACQELSAGR